MINKSKALKDFENNYKKPGKLYSWWIESRLSKYWNNFNWFFVKPYGQLRKLMDWQRNVFSKDYDFDAHCLFAIIEYKLKRVYPVLEKGYAIQEEQDMHALRLAIKLAERLKDDDYETREFARHDRKWGKLNMDINRVASWDSKGKPASYHCDMSRPGTITAELEEQEHKEFRESMSRSYAAMQRDQKNLYGILSKYLRVWWD